MKIYLFLLAFLLTGLKGLCQTNRLSIDLRSFNSNDTLIVMVKSGDSYNLFDSIYGEHVEGHVVKTYTYKEPAFVSIQTSNRNLYKQFIIDSDVMVSLDSSKGAFKITGSPSSTDLDTIQILYTSPARKKIVEVSNLINSFSAKSDTRIVDSLSTVQKLIMDSLKMQYRQYILAHPESFASLDLIMWGYNSFGVIEVSKLLNGLDWQIKNHSLVKYLEERIRKDLAIAEGTTLPSFSVYDERGNFFSSKQMQNGLYLLDFWGTWCGPCLQALPELRQMQRKYKEHGLHIISYAKEFSITEQQFGEFERKHEISWTSYYETQQLPSGIIGTFNVVEYPTYILVKDGVILKRSLGNSDLKSFVAVIELILLRNK